MDQNFSFATPNYWVSKYCPEH